jgi:hypothetical protein
LGDPLLKVYPTAPTFYSSSLRGEDLNVTSYQNMPKEIFHTKKTGIDVKLLIAM